MQYAREWNLTVSRHWFTGMVLSYHTHSLATSTAQLPRPRFYYGSLSGLPACYRLVAQRRFYRRSGLTCQV